MLGHDAIIAMRQRGRKPALVYLDTMRDHSPVPSWRDWPEVAPAFPTVWVQPADVPSRLDLRFVFGLTVVVSGTDADRVARLADAAHQAGALRVISAVFDADSNRVTATRVLDTFNDLDGDSERAARCAVLLAKRAELRSQSHG